MKKEGKIASPVGVVDDSSSFATVPSRLFADRRFSILEALSLYLVDYCGTSFRVAGKLIARDERTIWTCYHRALKKKKSQLGQIKNLKDVPRSVLLPLALFSDRRFSSLEVLVVYFREVEQYGPREIGALLNRNERTIWTCYSRACKKRGGLQ